MMKKRRAVLTIGEKNKCLQKRREKRLRMSALIIDSRATERRRREEAEEKLRQITEETRKVKEETRKIRNIALKIVVRMLTRQFAVDRERLLPFLIGKTSDELIEVVERSDD